MALCYRATRHGDVLDQLLNSDKAHSFDLSLWQLVQGFGMPNCFVSAGEMNSNVWPLTKFPAIVCSIFGMWQAVHSLPTLFSA